MSRGTAALAVGDWMSAKECFALAVEQAGSPEALDGLGRAEWWLKDVRGAIVTRARAHRGFKRLGRFTEAALVAVWLSRELRPLLRSDAAAEGWLARAETLAAAAGDASLLGWISLARAEAASDAIEAIAHCRSAVEESRRRDDPDLEIQSLARLGVLEVAAGRVDEGVTRLDEAMAAVSAGEARDLASVGIVFCALMELGELLGDNARFADWTAALVEVGGGHGFGPLDGFGAAAGYGVLSSFCGACCGGLYLVTGRLDEAEGELLAAVRDLETHEMGFRCVHPITQLAELRVLQGRFEEARELLGSYEDLPEAVRPLAVLEIAVGSPEAAAARLERRIHELGGLTVAAFPLLTVLVDAHLSMGRSEAAAEAVSKTAVVAGLTRSRRHRAEALFAEGKLAAIATRDDASSLLRQSAEAFSDASLALQACRARLELARTLVERDRPVAIAEARASLAAFDRLGAVPDADAAAAFLRELGVKGRTGPKDLDLLSKREIEVLRLVANGLSNGEIASRLFISTKTTGHHVSSVLSKLGLRSRTEAAAFAAIHLRSDQSGNRENAPSFVPPAGAR
ncbi:response regulator transcription factor [Microbacterium sp. NPDC019599]|uniref:response regulator transcription factor n=1 Tax=Microbacterium sp. NPDC019599 TaxID=3154690 RepID=UPI0033EF5A05